MSEKVFIVYLEAYSKKSEGSCQEGRVGYQIRTVSPRTITDPIEDAYLERRAM